MIGIVGDPSHHDRLVQRSNDLCGRLQNAFVAIGCLDHGPTGIKIEDEFNDFPCGNLELMNKFGGFERRRRRIADKQAGYTMRIRISEIFNNLEIQRLIVFHNIQNFTYILLGPLLVSRKSFEFTYG